MPTKIISFGFRHGQPDHGQIIDVRTKFNRNPWRRRSLRSLRGTDPEVQADIVLTPGYAESYVALVREVMQSPPGDLYLGCTGGHHRSVFLAEQIGRDLKLEVEHRDIEKA